MGNDEEDDSVWKKALKKIVAVGAGGLGAYGGWRLMKKSDAYYDLDQRAKELRERKARQDYANRVNLRDGTVALAASILPWAIGWQGAKQWRDARKAVKNYNVGVELNEGQTKLYAPQVQAAEAEVERIKKQIADKAKQIRDIETSISSGAYSDEVKTLQGEIRDLQSKLDKTIAATSPSSPGAHSVQQRIVDVNREIDELKAQQIGVDASTKRDLQMQVAERNQELRELRNELQRIEAQNVESGRSSVADVNKELKAKTDAMNAQIAADKKAIGEKLNVARGEFDTLGRDLETANGKVTSLKENIPPKPNLPERGKGVEIAQRSSRGITAKDWWNFVRRKGPNPLNKPSKLMPAAPYVSPWTKFRTMGGAAAGILMDAFGFKALNDANSASNAADTLEGYIKDIHGGN